MSVGRAGDRGRFPGFDVLGQARHWDPVTAGVVSARTGPPPAIRFFTAARAGDARPPCSTGCTGQDDEPRSAGRWQMVDARLAAGETDGWRYADMPEDGQAWRDTLAYLDKDAQAACGTGFADAPSSDQAALIQAVQDLATSDWHGLPAARVWSLWTRYACTAFYAHPSAWAEIGFPGPGLPARLQERGRRQAGAVRGPRRAAGGGPGPG